MTRHGVFGIFLVFALSILSLATELTILYTNDLHARLNRFTEIGRLVAETRADVPEVLLFDAGDAWQDHRFLLTNVWGDDATVDWMNGVSYSAMTIGNHDTYWGMSRFKQLLSAARFPILSANWQASGVLVEHVYPSVRLTIEGARILVIGLITPEFLPVPAYPMFRYREPLDAIQEEMARHVGTFDWLFVVGHLSVENATRIVQRIPEIDLFISGHSHEMTETPIMIGNSVIVQSGYFANALGRLHLELDEDTGVVEVLSNDLLPIEKTPVDWRPGILRFLAVSAAILAATVMWLF